MCIFLVVRSFSRKIFLSALICLFSSLAGLHAALITDDAWTKAVQDSDAVFVLENAKTGETFISDVKRANEKLAPCSTFKIWNSLIGLETGVVSDPDALFWKWDGEKRFLPDWNKDQTLRTAIASSCVPAYQSLARKIGKERMQKWLDTLGYGNRDMSAGLDIFWLPEPPDRKTILITPKEQADLLAKLLDGKFPVSEKSLEILSDITKLKTTPRGEFHGKTGTGSDYTMGWFVGWVIHDGETYTFACLIKGKKVMGKDARAIVESALENAGLL